MKERRRTGPRRSRVLRGLAILLPAHEFDRRTVAEFDRASVG